MSEYEEIINFAINTNILYINYNSDMVELFNRMSNWVQFFNGEIIKVFSDSGCAIYHNKLEQDEDFSKNIDKLLVSAGGYGGDGEYLGIKYVLHDTEKTDAIKYMLGIVRYSSSNYRRCNINFDELINDIISLDKCCYKPTEKRELIKNLIKNYV